MLLLQTNDVLRRFGADVLFHNINLQVVDHARARRDFEARRL